MSTTPHLGAQNPEHDVDEEPEEPDFDALTGLVAAAGERARALGYLGPEVPLSELTECAHEEVSELFRAYRRGELDAPCDKPIPLTCGEEECADMLQRVLELAAFLKVDLARAHRIKSEFSLTQPHRGAGGRRA